MAAIGLIGAVSGMFPLGRMRGSARGRQQKALLMLRVGVESVTDGSDRLAALCADDQAGRRAVRMWILGGNGS